MTQQHHLKHHQKKSSPKPSGYKSVTSRKVSHKMSNPNLHPNIMQHHNSNSHPPHQSQNPMSSAYSSPPSSPMLKAKNSKSRRFFVDAIDTPGTTWTDYVLLVIYFIGLYLFYAAFWYTAWSIYLATTPTNRPRYAHEEFNSTNGESRSSLLCSNLA